MYDQDSFFTLTSYGQAGLLTLSILMFVIQIWGMSRLRAHWGVKLSIALVGFYIFVWLSPQIYYGYYLLVFDSLPLQIVIGGPPSPMRIIQLLTFSGQHNLSAHGQGSLGWCMIITCLLSQFSQKCRDAAN